MSLFAVKPQPWTPHDYQKRAVKFLLEHAHSGLFIDPGMGKTSITLAALTILKRKKMLERTLIIAPLRVCYSVWPAELEKWSDFAGLSMCILHGQYEKNKRIYEDHDIYVINPEGLAWFFDPLEKPYRTVNAKALIVDESSRFKNTNSQRFKILKPHLGKFYRRTILTGSPAPRSLIDLFGQMYIVDTGKAFGPYITHFRRKYFDPIDNPQYNIWAPREDTSERLAALMKPSILRLKDEDYLELPEIVPNNIRIDLPPAARKIYETMEDNLFSMIDRGIVTAANAAAATGKCRQIANGGLYLEVAPGEKRKRMDERWELVHDEKTAVIESLVEELSGSQLLVAYDFEHDRERLLKALGKNTPWIGGGVSPAQSKSIEDLWNAEQISVLLGQPASMAHGINIQYGSCKDVAWHSLIYNYEDYMQFIRRVRRQGNKAKRVFVHHIIARDTVDEAILGNIKVKGRTEGKFLDSIRSYRKGKGK